MEMTQPSGRRESEESSFVRRYSWRCIGADQTGESRFHSSQVTVYGIASLVHINDQ